MADGKVQNEMALVGKYRTGFTGKVPSEFSKPSAFNITPGYSGGEGAAREAYGLNKQGSHPTPESPNYGAVYKK